MECMCVQTRPRFILSSERVLGEWRQKHIITPREKFPLPQREVEPTTSGQRAQHTSYIAYSSQGQPVYLHIVYCPSVCLAIVYCPSISLLFTVRPSRYCLFYCPSISLLFILLSIHLAIVYFTVHPSRYCLFYLSVHLAIVYCPSISLLFILLSVHLAIVYCPSVSLLFLLLSVRLAIVYFTVSPCYCFFYCPSVLLLFILLSVHLAIVSFTVRPSRYCFIVRLYRYCFIVRLYRYCFFYCPSISLLFLFCPPVYLAIVSFTVRPSRYCFFYCPSVYVAIVYCKGTADCSDMQLLRDVVEWWPLREREKGGRSPKISKQGSYCYVKVCVTGMTRPERERSDPRSSAFSLYGFKS